jgi:hypothetical protein
MKHLTTLEGGNLVVVRRQGKFRVNFLNAIPLQEMHNRWVGKYMESTAASLLTLRYMLNKQEEILIWQKQNKAEYFELSKKF